MQIFITILTISTLAWSHGLQLRPEPRALVDGRPVDKYLFVNNPYHDAGKWGNEDICPNGTYVHAVSMKYEEPGHIDETAVNIVSLHCTDGANDRGEVTSTQGDFGAEFGKQPCTSPNLATGFQTNTLKYEGAFTDDVAVQDFRLVCAYGAELIEGLPENADKPKDFNKGDWSTTASCDSPSMVCGIQTRWEKSSIGDEVSICEVALLCCSD